MRRRGFTLIELLVYCALSLVIGLAAASLFRLMQGMMITTNVSYLVSRDLEVGLGTFRRDLEEAPLASLQIQSPSAPGATKGQPPGLSMQTARDGQGNLVLGDLGVPQWQGWVYYTLQPTSEVTGDLVRWEQAQVSDLPLLAPALPSPVPATATRRKVVLRSVVLPGAVLPGISSGETLTADLDGGFQVRYVRTDRKGDARTYSLSPSSPEQVTAGQVPGLDVGGNTRLVEVRVQVFEPSGTGKATYLSLSFRARPRY